MVVAGSKRPWWYMVIGASVLLLVTLVTLTKPHERFSSIKSSALDKVCAERGYGMSAPAPSTPHNFEYTEPLVETETNHYKGKSNYTQSDKPPVKVIALVFAGRQRYLEILDCYLQRNLARNGGWLDEVKWAIKTDNEDDKKYIQHLVNTVPEYTSSVGEKYMDAYKQLEQNAIYVKIDDDVVFMEDHAIPAIVSRVYNNPQYSIVSANVMNQPALSFVHYHLGAIHPYLPEFEQPTNHVDDKPVTNWRPSANPHWAGDLDALADELDPPYKNHRWLRLPREPDLVQTPAGKMGHDGAEYNAFSVGWRSWAIAAQQHYSFLENLEKQELWRYKVDIWHYWYERLSINFIAFQSSLIIENPIPDTDDEVYLTQQLPKELHRPAVLDGTAMVVHFGFGTQTEKLSETDLLGRYKKFAEENVCQRPWGQSWVLGG